jgi:hypothetical protein
MIGNASIPLPDPPGLRRVRRLCRFRHSSNHAKTRACHRSCRQLRRRFGHYPGPDPRADRHRCVHGCFPVQNSWHRRPSVWRSAGLPSLVDRTHRRRRAGCAGRKIQAGTGSRECCFRRIVDLPVLPRSWRLVPCWNLPAQPRHPGRQLRGLIVAIKNGPQHRGPFLHAATAY